AERHEGLSDEGAVEEKVACVEEGRQCESAGLASAGDGPGEKDLRAEASEDTMNHQCGTPETAEEVVGERGEREQRPRMVMAWPRVERGSATATKPESNRERKRRRREERRRIRELTVAVG